MLETKPQYPTERKGWSLRESTCTNKSTYMSEFIRLTLCSPSQAFLSVIFCRQTVVIEEMDEYRFAWRMENRREWEEEH